MNKKDEIYARESHRKNSEIEKIDEKFLLKTEAFKTIKKYFKIILIFLMVFTLLLVVTSISIIPIYLMLIILSISIIFFNSYKIQAEDNKMTIVQDFQEVILDYSQIKNVYMQRGVNKIFFRKIYSYNIVIIYETIRGKILDISFPTLFLNSTQIEKFLNHFTVKKTNKNYIQAARKNKMKRKLIRALLFILFLILIIVTYIVQK